MKALTLVQPWASLVALGHKRVETRSWRTHYRGPLAIHASQTRLPAYLLEQLELQLRALGIELPEDMPRGCVVATARLSVIRPTDDFGMVPDAGLWWGYELDARKEALCGDFSAGRFAWVLDQVEALDPPVLATGARGLWDWEAQ